MAQQKRIAREAVNRGAEYWGLKRIAGSNNDFGYFGRFGGRGCCRLCLKRRMRGQGY
jgi:hypothetical protein